jgi:hypothetical protein
MIERVGKRRIIDATSIIIVVKYNYDDRHDGDNGAMPKMAPQWSWRLLRRTRLPPPWKDIPSCVRRAIRPKHICYRQSKRPLLEMASLLFSGRNIVNTASDALILVKKRERASLLRDQ